MAHGPFITDQMIRDLIDRLKTERPADYDTVKEIERRLDRARQLLGSQ